MAQTNLTMPDMRFWTYENEWKTLHSPVKYVPTAPNYFFIRKFPQPPQLLKKGGTAFTRKKITVEEVPNLLCNSVICNVFFFFLVQVFRVKLIRNARLSRIIRKDYLAPYAHKVTVFVQPHHLLQKTDSSKCDIKITKTRWIPHADGSEKAILDLFYDTPETLGSQITSALEVLLGI